jgi:hypothetical protein
VAFLLITHFIIVKGVEKGIQRLYFLPPGNQTSPKVRSFFSIIPSKGNQTCDVRSEHRRLYYFSFAWVTILDDKEYPALSL